MAVLSVVARRGTSRGAGPLVPFIKTYASYAGRSGIVALALMVLAGVFEGVGLAFLLPIVALLTGGDTGRAGRLIGRALAMLPWESRVGQLAMVLGLFVLVMAMRAAVLMARDRRISVLQLGFVEHQRLRLMRALGQARWDTVAGLRHARVTKAIASDVDRIAVAAQLMMQGAVMAIMLIAQLLLTWLIAPTIASVALAVFIGGALVMRPALRRATAQGSALGTGYLAMVDLAGQLLGGLKLAMAQNMQRSFTAEFEAMAREMTVDQLRYQRRQSVLRVLTSTAMALAGSLVLLIGFWREGSTVAVIAALAIASRMAGPAMVLQQNAQQLANFLPAHASTDLLITELEQNGEATASDIFETGDASISVRGVGYAHPGSAGRAGVRALDVTIAAGEIVGLIGASGAGKTTFVDLLAGLLEPQTGEIRIGGTLLDRTNAAAWRDRIAYVPQDPYLFNASLRRNLAVTRMDQDDVVLWRALERAGAGDLVRALPAGLETPVGERGAWLSGGERQRIALSRALVRQPAMLILDEAMNAIDITAEREILARLSALEPRPTIVIVSHRPETLEVCDRVITLVDGGIADESCGQRPNSIVQG